MIDFYEGKNAILQYAAVAIIGTPLMVEFADRGRDFDAAFVGPLVFFAIWRIVAIGRGKKWDK